jgi:RNA polymerase sigma-70 factor, ECF subfamily
MGYEMTNEIPMIPSERVVRAFRFAGDDGALVKALREGHPGASAALYDRYASHVQRVIVRILGFDSDIEDLLQEVFLQALGSVSTIEDGNRLRAWITIVAVHTARAHIRRRSKKRWLVFWEPASLPDVPGACSDFETREILRFTYGVLDRMSAKERILLTLRHFDGMPLVELAEMNGVSLATVKRQLDKAQMRFTKIAQRYPLLAAHLAEVGKWRSQ